MYTWGPCTPIWRCVYMSLAQMYTDARTRVAYMYIYIDVCSYCIYIYAPCTHIYVPTPCTKKCIRTGLMHIHI